MNVIDSSGWIEYLAGGPNAEFFASYGATLWTHDGDFEGMEEVRFRARR